MSNYFKMFCHRIGKDLKQKKLVPLKLLFFMHTSSILVLYPYLTIHMRELGINVEEAAIMSAVIPVLSILMPPVAGILADKIGNFRILLSIFSALGGASALLLLIIPVGRITITYPDNVVFSMSCNPKSSMMLSLSQHYHPCEPLGPENKTELQLESCGFICLAVLPKNHTDSILRSLKYGIQIHDFRNNSSKMYMYTLSPDDIHEPVVISETFNHKTLKNNERYRTSVRRLTKNSYYFPATGLFNFSCDLMGSPNLNCAIGTGDILNKFDTRLKNKFNATIYPANVTHVDAVETRRIYRIRVEPERENVCVDGYIKPGQYVSITIPLNNTSNSSGSTLRHLDLGSCAARCLMTTPRKNICSNKKIVREVNMSLTFWSYMAVRVFIGIISGTAFAMFEGAVIAILRQQKADYGLQRIYATIGGMISSPLSGFLIDYASRGKGYTDYSPIFYLYAIMKMLSAFLMLFIHLEFKMPATSVISDVLSVLNNVELLALFAVALSMGSAWGYIESFLFWLLEDLGGTRSLMGFTITVAGLVGIPLLVLSGPIIKRLGHANVLCISFLFYVIRLVGYSLIYNPWLCLIFEAMESVTMGLCFTAAVTYAAKLSTVTTDTTVQAILFGLYYGVGKGVGSLIGGYMIQAFGIRATFRDFAVFSGFAGLLYFGFHHLYMKNRSVLQPTDSADKPSQDVNLITVKGHPEIPAVYEDALTNPAYEDAEISQSDESSHM